VGGSAHVNSARVQGKSVVMARGSAHSHLDFLVCDEAGAIPRGFMGGVPVETVV